MSGSVAHRPEVRGALAFGGTDGHLDFSEPEPRLMGSHDHLAGELHAVGAERK
ncbi:MAG: hypothetical protein AAFR76_03005 [Planctomycetota bacterium]